STGEVRVERLDVDGDGSERLKGVEDYMGSNFVRFVDDGFGVVDVGAAKDNVRNRDEQRLIVDGVEQAVGGNGDAVVGFDHVNFCSVGALRFPEIHYGGKVHVAVNDLVALGLLLSSEIETRCDDGLAGGDVLMQRDGIFGRVHQGAEFVADFEGEHPPALFPGANSAGCPDVGVGVERVVNGARHGSQGVGDHVVGALKDGKLGAVTQKIVAQKIGHVGHCNWSVDSAVDFSSSRSRHSAGEYTARTAFLGGTPLPPISPKLFINNDLASKSLDWRRLGDR